MDGHDHVRIGLYHVVLDRIGLDIFQSRKLREEKMAELDYDIVKMGSRVSF